MEQSSSLIINRRGLPLDSITERRSKYGWNELPEKKRSLLWLFARQFQNTLVYILIGALVLSVSLRLLEGSSGTDGVVDAVVILAILVLNALLGFLQEYKAEEAIAALRELTSPQTRVQRGGQEMMIPSRELLPDDMVILDTGDRVTADGQLITSSHLEINESSLTGESEPVHKAADARNGIALSEQKSRVFAGTIVTRGSGEYVVTAIGTQTEIGKVALLVASTKLPETPLALRMKRLSNSIGLIVLALCALVIMIGFYRHMPVISIVLLAVSMAVSAVPEGLPAVVTAGLAMGVRRMAAKNALVRRLDALETLGSVTVICSDKTGTITENRMKVRHTWLAEDNEHEAHLLGQIASSSNRAELPNIGDPTEIGLLEYAADNHIDRLPIEDEEVPFSSEEKYMQTRHGERSFLKGAPEKILMLCSQSQHKAAQKQMRTMASQGLRILGCAVLDENQTIPRFVGLIAMEDPPRTGVQQAIAEAAHAGIRTIMITGDNIDTATAIAHEVGITGGGMEGKDVDAMSPTELENTVRTTSIFARVSPTNKIAILEALKRQGEIVSMTGDGVNDAPALKSAHAGIAMGKAGTQVAKEAASIILADDSFSTIVSAIREGRRIYDNIRKFVLYLLRANFGELLFITTSLAIGLPVPYLPIHILWINLMTDGLPALALATEAEDPNIMNRPPRNPQEHMFTGEWSRFLLYVAFAFLVPFTIFEYELSLGVNIEHVRTMTFTTAIIFELFLAFTTRSPYPLWQIGFFTNRWLLGAVAVPLLLHMVLLYTPLHIIFGLEPISAAEWGIVLGITLSGFLALEVIKLLYAVPQLNQPDHAPVHA
ncbi:MAG: yloB [Candidatus Peribacteria bacterium]|nr:yloB [Candidatus Peribacteria bacterium]